VAAGAGSALYLRYVLAPRLQRDRERRVNARAEEPRRKMGVPLRDCVDLRWDPVDAECGRRAKEALRATRSRNCVTAPSVLRLELRHQEALLVAVGSRLGSG